MSQSQRGVKHYVEIGCCQLTAVSEGMTLTSFLESVREVFSLKMKKRVFFKHANE